MTKMRITPKLTTEFLNDQLQQWPVADLNYIILEKALEEDEEILFKNCFWVADKFIVNYRKGSLTADPKAALAGVRPCFLCDGARPVEQYGLEWENYNILVNPYPLSIPHFTIVHREHIPQRICGHILEMVKMTRLFEECCVFYNGPLCGASAPDHLHFQAFDIYNFRNIYQTLTYGFQISTYGKSSILIPPSNMSAVPFILINLAKDADLGILFDKVISALPEADPEPMMNIAAAKHKSHTLIAIFPRRKHRPDCYGQEQDQLLVSPAAAEMLGNFPCVSQKEFDHLDEETIQRIYDEVCVTRETFVKIIDRIGQ